ncbi:hypothetical protein OAB01_03445 [Bacteroidia bacterium]|nr:hypothetical protein [Bacteroidia bacterium]
MARFNVIFIFLLFIFCNSTHAQNALKLNYGLNWNVLGMTSNTKYTGLGPRFSLQKDFGHKKVKPYVSLDLLGYRDYQCCEHFGARQLSNYSRVHLKTDFSAGFKIGNHKRSLNVGISIQKYGLALLNGSVVYNNFNYPTTKANELYTDKLVFLNESTYPWILPRVEYSFNTSTTKGKIVEYKMGTNLLNAYFLIGISRKKVLKPLL